MASSSKIPSALDSNFPVLVPYDEALFYDESKFVAHITNLFKAAAHVLVRSQVQSLRPPRTEHVQTTTGRSSPAIADKSGDGTRSSFVDGLASFDPNQLPENFHVEDRTLTANGDVAFGSSKNALVDLFYELEDTVESGRLKELLPAAWAVDSLTTLKIIFNGRSIHLGKSSRTTLYRCAGWLRHNHPLTLLLNLRWLVRPIISKKGRKLTKDITPKSAANTTEVEDNDFEAIDADLAELALDIAPAEEFVYDIKDGLAHGYWKDLLNLLALEANDLLDVAKNPSRLLNDHPVRTREREYSVAKAKVTRDRIKLERHIKTMAKFNYGFDPFYRAMHLTVARLFIEQLKIDRALLLSGDAQKQQKISLAGKWAPSGKGFHDKHTFIVSTIAEGLARDDDLGVSESADREEYLRAARIAFQKTILSRLRSHLDVVERDITVKRYDRIKYEIVPSLAMDAHSKLFFANDEKRFTQYLRGVAEGKQRISGAVLLPSTLVKKACDTKSSMHYRGAASHRKYNPKKRHMEDAMAECNKDMVNGQWKALVQRLRDVGELDSAIAVCDVSGSMSGPILADGTAPIHTALGMSLLLAEVTAPPFGGGFITFSSTPQFIRVGGPEDRRDLYHKIRGMEKSEWSMNTDFEAVFVKLILPMAVNNQLKDEEMVKRVFVFSDMQFDQAQNGRDRWTSSYERIRKAFQEQKLSVPELVFWNLAGGQRGVATKPVTNDSTNTALVSGYSQAMLRMYLDKNGFDRPEEEISETVVADEDGEETVEVSKKAKTDPLATVMRAVSHDAYKMLKVVD